jgi:hypothetical protein
VGDVFISHTSDMASYPRARSYVRAAMDAVARAGHVAVDMSLFPAGETSPAEYCRARVQACALYVGVIGFRYGSLVPGSEVSYTDLEFRAATEAGIPRLLFLLDEETPLPPSLVDTDRSRVSEFRGRLRDAGIVVTAFTSPEDLDGRVLHALHALQALHQVSGPAAGRPDGERPDRRRADALPSLLAAYRARLEQRYRSLDLEVLAPTDQEEQPPMLLRSVFVPPQVRPDLPPLELSKELQRSLVEDGQLDRQELPEGVDPDRLARERIAYQQRPLRPVLDVLADPEHRQLVVLGDPGAGKSTLTRYLALSLAAGGARPPLSRLDGWVPLLVELRAYADLRGEFRTFLEYLDHLHEIEGLGLPAADLEELLRGDGRAVVIFDGLDEVFDPRDRDAIGRQIAAFGARYPQARVVVTSRPIGYGRHAFTAAGFAHVTLQDLTEPEIGQFVRRWYDLALPDDPAEAGRRRERLLHAVAESASIRELAGNPLLLTVLAIIGRRQELPRERRAVYAHAAGVLVERWDVNRHLRDHRIDTGYLDVEDKRELLRRVARRLQSGRSGLGGNHIRGAVLIEEITAYLTERYPQDPPSAKKAATAILAQFRERNFILTLYGAEVYGFVHRAFLEFFCADDIVGRFQNKRELTPEQLTTDVIGRHWAEPAWQEVLLLVAGMVDDRFTAQIVEYLVRLAHPFWNDEPPRNLLLAARCIAEVRRPPAVTRESELFLTALIRLVDQIADDRDTAAASFVIDELLPVLALMGPRWPARERFRRWYLAADRFQVTDPRLVGARIMIALWPDDPTPRRDLLANAVLHEDWSVRQEAVATAARAWPTDRDVRDLLRDRMIVDDDEDVRMTAMKALAEAETPPARAALLRDRALHDLNDRVRQEAVELLARPGEPASEPDPAVVDLLFDRVSRDTHEGVRAASLVALARAAGDDPLVLAALLERAGADPNPRVRAAALRQLAVGWADTPAAVTIARRLATEDPSPLVRRAAVETLSRSGLDEPEVPALIIELAARDPDSQVRQAAVDAPALVPSWPQPADRLGWILERARLDTSPRVRLGALTTLDSMCGDEPWLHELIVDRLRADGHHSVRDAAADTLTDDWDNDPDLAETIVSDVVPLLADPNVDPNVDLRRAFTEIALRRHPLDPDAAAALRAYVTEGDSADATEKFVKEVLNTADAGAGTLEALRSVVVRAAEAGARREAVTVLASRWHSAAGTRELLTDSAAGDGSHEVRAAAIEGVADRFAAPEATRRLLLDRAVHDADFGIRQAAVAAVGITRRGGADLDAWLRWRAVRDPSPTVRQTALHTLARECGRSAPTMDWLRWRIRTEPSEEVAARACELLAECDEPPDGGRGGADAGRGGAEETRRWLRAAARRHPEAAVRAAAATAIARRWPDDPATAAWLRERAVSDGTASVRSAVLGALTLRRYRHGEPAVAEPADPPPERPEPLQPAEPAKPAKPADLAYLAEPVGLLIDRLTNDDAPEVRVTAAQLLVRGWPDDQHVLERLRTAVLADVEPTVRQAASRVLRHCWADITVAPWLEQTALTHPDPEIRTVARAAIAAAAWSAGHCDPPEPLVGRAAEDPSPFIRYEAMGIIAEGWPDSPDVAELLRTRARVDAHWKVRMTAVELASDPADTAIAGAAEWLTTIAAEDPDRFVRREALNGIMRIAPDHPATVDLLRTLAGADPAAAVRQHAIEKLAEQADTSPDAVRFLIDRAELDPAPGPRAGALEAVAGGGPKSADIDRWLRDRAEQDPDADVRIAALRARAASWAGPSTWRWLVERAADDPAEEVRGEAARAAVEALPAAPELAAALRAQVERDVYWSVRDSTTLALAARGRADPATLDWLRERAVGDQDEYIREQVVEVVVRAGAAADGLVGWLRTLAVEDSKPLMRGAALTALARCRQDGAALALLRERAADDRDDGVRQTALELVATGWPDDPDTRGWLADRAERERVPRRTRVVQAALDALAKHDPW